MGGVKCEVIHMAWAGVAPMFTARWGTDERYSTLSRGPRISVSDAIVISMWPLRT